MPDSSAIDNALVAKLAGDATLVTAMPDGVHWDVAPPGSRRFVLVSLVDEEDVQQFGQRSFEDAVYLVKAVGLSTTSPNVQGAAARIDALLDGGTLTAAGYTLMTVHRERRLRVTEQDDEDPSIRWFHRGGYYRVAMST